MLINLGTFAFVIALFLLAFLLMFDYYSVWRYRRLFTICYFLKYLMLVIMLLVRCSCFSISYILLRSIFLTYEYINEMLGCCCLVVILY